MIPWLQLLPLFHPQWQSSHSAQQRFLDEVPAHTRRQHHNCCQAWLLGNKDPFACMTAVAAGTLPTDGICEYLHNSNTFMQSLQQLACFMTILLWFSLSCFAFNSCYTDHLRTLPTVAVVTVSTMSKSCKACKHMTMSLHQIHIMLLITVLVLLLQR